jgi:hypothetical protein
MTIQYARASVVDENLKTYPFKNFNWSATR